MKKDGRSISHEALETCRFAAIKLHKANVHVEVIADSMGVTRQAVYRWLRTCRSCGEKALKSSKATGSEMQMTEEQINTLKKLLRKPATQLGYSTDLWSGPRVRHLIGEQFGVKYHKKHMPRLMKSLGFMLKFPERRALEQDPVAVKQWKKERLPEIIKSSSKQRSLLFYADESLVSLIPYIGKTWTLPDRQPIVRVSGRRGQHVGVTAAVNQQGRMCFELTKESETFTAGVFIRFLKKMRCEFPGRFITIIVDGAAVHKAKVVREFQASNASWLRLEILPAYSPELNPTEKSWRFLKTKKLSGSVAKDRLELRKGTIKALRQIKKDKSRVASFFEKL